jgi:hypothetical protein
LSFEVRQTVTVRSLISSSNLVLLHFEPGIKTVDHAEGQEENLKKEARQAQTVQAST